MWVSRGGGFETVAVPDPSVHLTSALLGTLRRMSVDLLSELSERVDSLSDEAFLHLRSLELAQETTDEFVGAPLPDDIIFDLPDEDIFQGLRAQVLRVPVRWRLDASLLLLDGIDSIQSE